MRMGLWTILFLCSMSLTVEAGVGDTQQLESGTQKITANTTFEQHVVFKEGAVLDIAKGVTVTFRKGFTADDRQIFAGEGRLSGVKQLTPEWFGAVGDGEADDTVAIQRALDSFDDYGFGPGGGANKSSNVLLLRNKYRVSSLNADTTCLNIRCENAWLIAQETGNYPYLIRFTRQFCTVTGNLSVEGNYNLGYDCLINVNSRYFVANNIVIWRAALAWRFGSMEWATSNEPGKSELGDSEVLIQNCTTAHCLRAVEAIGSNTIICIADSLMYSYPWTLPEGDPRKQAWENADLTLVRSYSALIYFTGGQLANFNPNVPLCEVRPLRNTQEQYYSNYGAVIIANAHIEGGNFFAAVNPDKIPTQDFQGNKVRQKFISFSMTTCGGYVTGAVPPIKTDPMFTGGIVVENNNFYGHDADTFAEIGNPEATIKVDDVTLRNKWSRGLNAIKGGTALFTQRLVLDMRRSGQQVSGGAANVVFTEQAESDDTGHFIEHYNRATGEFRIPNGGLNNVQVQAGLQAKDEATAGNVTIEILRNGKAIAKQRLQGGSGTISALLPKLAAGDVLSVRAQADGQKPVALSNDDLNYFQILASRD